MTCLFLELCSYKKMSRPLRFFNMYLTSTISVALVLMLIGMLCCLLLSANTLVKRLKENVAITLVLNQDADSTAIASCDKMLSHASYCLEYRYISREQALEEHIQTLGEDPTKFLGYNPLSNAFEFHPTETYAHPDSIAAIEQTLTALPYVDRLIYQQDILALMNKNFVKVAWGLLGIAAVMLLIALVLIVNTIRLQIYAKRFLIRTMTLVGATGWMVRAPFVRRNIGIGLAAALIAILVLGGVIYYLQFQMGIRLFEINTINIAFLAGTIVVSGILITTLAAIFSTGRYIRMNADTLYRI